MHDSCSSRLMWAWDVPPMQNGCGPSNRAPELFLSQGVRGPLENLSENMSVHLLWLVNAIQGEDRRCYVVDAGFKSHQAQIVLDIRSHGKERSRNFISVREVM